MSRYFFDIKNGHKPVDPSGTECKNDTDAVDKAKRIAIGVSLDRPDAVLRWCLQLTVKPPGGFAGLHRIELLDQNVVDVMAGGALKRPNIEVRRAGCDSGQPRGCLARWTWWLRMMEHDARLDQAGALQDSQSPVDAVSGR